MSTVYVFSMGYGGQNLQRGEPVVEGVVVLAVTAAAAGTAAAVRRPVGRARAHRLAAGESSVSLLRPPPSPFSRCINSDGNWGVSKTAVSPAAITASVGRRGSTVACIAFDF